MEDYQIESKQILFATHFYQSLESYAITRTYKNISGVLAELGGLSSLVFVAFSLIGNLINRHFMIQKISRAIFYFTTVYSSSNEDIEVQKDFSRDKFTYSLAIKKQKRNLMKICCCRKGKKSSVSTTDAYKKSI